jgi:hypothetical protein
MERCISRKSSTTNRCSQKNNKGPECFLYRNSKTNRCTKRCESVWNKQTGRCVLRNGSVGKHLKGRLKQCSAKRDQKTGRCKLSGKSRQQASGKGRKRSSRRSRKRPNKASEKRGTRRMKRAVKTRPLTCIPTKFEGIVHECECQKRWRQLTKLGSGKYGAAYHACSVENSKDCDYVVKVQPNNNIAKREFDAYMRLNGKTRVVPKLHAAWVCGGKMYLVLDRMKPCKVTKAAVKLALASLLRLGWLHVDVHSGNVMCNKRGKVCLIDLGWAVHEDDEPFNGHPTGAKTFDRLRAIQEHNVSNLN